MKRLRFNPYPSKESPYIFIHLISILFFLFLGLNITGQEINFNQPPNSSYLSEFQLSPKIFNTLLSPMYQEDAVFSGKLELTESFKNAGKSVAFELIYDPFYEYGLTLNLVVHDKSGYDLYPKKELKRFVGKSHEKYKKIMGTNLIGEQEVGLIERNGNSAVLGFSLRKNALPNSMKYLNRMTGKVYINEGILEKIELSLEQPARIRNLKANSGKITAGFQQLENGGYLLESFEELFSGTVKGDAVETSTRLNIIKYDGADRELYHDFQSEVEMETVPGVEPDTLSVKLERALPLLGNAARRAGYELPLPYGVDLFTHFQSEIMNLEKVVLDGDDLTNELLAPGKSSAETTTTMVASRADVWILPFFNVTVIGGYMHGISDVKLALSDDAKEALDMIGLKTDNIEFSTRITGTLMGAGCTTAGGYKNFFATVNAMYLRQYVNEINSEVDAIAITPLVGLRMPKSVNVIVGAQYQLYDSSVSGSIQLEGEPLSYKVDMTAKKWNWLVGLQRDFSNHWNGSIMVGPEPRPQATLVIGYRF